ncbi:MAG TPA: M20/M25/M40 family metallo-hydrolase [Gemmatimonadaceae bacterium]
MSRPIVAALSCATLLFPASASAQRASRSGNDDVAAAVAAWIKFPAPPGTESAAAARLGQVLRGWAADAQGNLIRRVGSGTPRRVVACGMDFSAYVVSQITDDGYLRLRRTGSSSHPLWDQFHEAQLLTVFTALGPRSGVVAVPNGHFAQQHRGDTVARTMDDLWVDIGASSAEEAGRAGVSLLDPVQIDRPAWTYEGFAAGPAAGARAGCAAVATAANGTVRSGETIFVLSTQRVYGWRGLASVMGKLGRVASLTLIDDGAAGTTPLTVGNRLGGRGYGGVARTATADSVRVITPRVRFAGSIVESIHADDARALLDAVLNAGAVSLEQPTWVAPPLDTARTLSPRGGRLGELERAWMALADLPGVSGHEHLVRAAVLAALPDWARRRAVVDSLGNVIVAMGPDRDSVAFIAHMDEVGFEVTGILPDGRVRLRTRGGAVIPSWEGVPAYLHFDPVGDAPPAAPLRGVFVPRDSGRTRSPGTLTAWFGLDSAALVARNVRPGQMVTAYKRAARLLGARITGRGSDDRSGTTALLFAIRQLQPDSLSHKVIFVWSVAEEGGLVGARYFGERHGMNLRRVYSVDTFVSSDSPLESPHFAFAPLGRGPVLRGVDNSSLVAREERERIIQIARANAIPLQVGTTFGSTDGSSIQIWGPPNIGLSWPGRYSHGPAEVLDLRDLDGLVRLVVAVAKAN